MQRICPEHQKELKKGTKGSWYCSTPARKDTKGNVLEWCKYREFDEPEEVQVFKKKAGASIEDQFVMDYLERIEKKLDDVLSNIKG